jgi:hypothetical protein
MMAMAMGHVWTDRVEQMRSLVRPVAMKLNDILKTRKALAG